MSDLVQYATHQMEREFIAETGVDEKEIDWGQIKFKPLAFSRELIRGGKPQFFFLIEIPELDNDKFHRIFKKSREGLIEFVDKLITKEAALDSALSPEFAMNLIYAFQYIQHNNSLPLDPIRLRNHTDINPASIVATSEDKSSHPTIIQEINMTYYQIIGHGNFMSIKSKLENLTQTIGELPNTGIEEKAKLEELIKHLSEILQKTPEDKVQEANRISTMVTRTVEDAKSGDKSMFEKSANLLKKATEVLTDTVPAAIKVVNQIIEILAI